MNRMIFAALALSLTLAVILLGTYFGYKPSPKQVFQVKSGENVVLFGVTPWADLRQIKEAYRPLLNYMTQKTGKKFQLLAMEDYDTAIENIADGNIDIFILPPVSYVVAKGLEPGIQYISTIIREHEGSLFATYKGYLIANDSRYHNWTIEDFLKAPAKYNIGFVTKTSGSGWAYPMAMFKKRGIDPFKAFKGVIIFENHPALTDAIATGKIDIGATWEYNLEQAEQKYGKKFRILYTTPEIPGLVWVASKKIDKDLVDKIRQTQMELNNSNKLKETLLKDTPDKGWVVLDESFYDSVREVVKYVGEFK